MKNTKENLTVTALHDRDGHSRTTIMEESEIIKAVESWLENNSFEQVLKEKGIYRWSQSYGNYNEIVVDARTGEISHNYSQQNTYGSNDSFFITLVSIQEQDKDDDYICEGAEMVVEATEQEIIDATEFQNNIDELEVEKLENGKYRIDWWENKDYIEAEKFVQKLIGEEWEDWVDNYTDYLLEDIELVNTWQEQVEEYYNITREINDYEDRKL